MQEVIIGLVFVVMFFSPCVLAGYCSSERRLLRRKVRNCCPPVDRRDPR